jgi:hypothetical protein
VTVTIRPEQSPYPILDFDCESELTQNRLPFLVDFFPDGKHYHSTIAPKISKADKTIQSLS